MTGADPLRDPIDELAEEFLVRYRRGERPALSEYIGRRPDLGDDIRDLFPALVLLEEAGPGEPPAPAGFGRGTAAGRTPERLGDYRILREVGRGGMGVVYEAEQESLGRHVALKVLPAEAASDLTCLKRFCREARAAARLHHTNIVPVHDVGAHDGIHYYAMQFIQGQSLDEVLAELRRLRQSPAEPPPTDGLTGGPRQRKAADLTRNLASHLLTGQFLPPLPVVGEGGRGGEGEQAVERPPGSDASAVCNDRSDFSTSSDFQFYRSLARIGLQIAEALAYAHSQGVLHRDVKPGNLLLDQRGTVWVTDFGLAKDESEALTRTGNVVGTLRYMPPERFDGVSDGRGDVYSLGLTLYELLTLRPAFDESDQARLIRRVVHEEPPRPRRYDRRVPRDRETNVLKAMAKEPGRRYQTAEAMATDLRHFLADEPIRARRSSWLEQVMRLGRRNPVVAGLSAVVAVLTAVSLVVLIVAGLVEQERAKAVVSQQRAEQAETEALAAKAENKVREHLARAAALRRSGQVGQRFQSLAQLSQALRLDPSPELRREIRDEAVAALVLPDVAIARDWPGWPEDTVDLDFDDSLQRFARLDRQGGVALGRVTETGEDVVARLPSRGQAPYHRLWMSPDGRFVLVWHSLPPGGTGTAFTVWKLDWQRAGLAPTAFPTERVTSGLYGPAFTPDSQRLAVVRADRLVDIFDLETGQLVRHLATDDPIYSLAFHPGGETLAVSSGADVLLFEVATGRQCQRLRHPDGVTRVTGLAWHPAGRRLLAACDDRKIHVWDAEAAREAMPPWRGQANLGIRLAFNHAGDRLVSIDWDRQTRLWDATSGRVLLTLPGNFGLQFSSDDTMLGWQRSGSNVRLWRVAAGRELHVLRHPVADGREFLAWPVPDADGRVLAAISSRGLCFFDVARGEELASVPMPNPDYTYFRCFIPPGGWLMSNPANGHQFWPVQPAPDQPDLLVVGPPRPFATAGFAGVSATPDGRVVALTTADGALVLHRHPPRRSFALKPQKDVRHVAVSPDGHWVVTCSFQADPVASVRIWNAQTGEHVRNLPQDEWSVPWFSPDSRWLAVNTTRQDCRLWEVGTWREVRRYDEAFVAFSPDRRTLALDDVIGQVRLVETETDREVVRLTGPEPLWYDPACFTPDGARLIAMARDYRAIYIWDLRSIREQLRAIDLDWVGPEFEAAPPVGRPLELRVDVGDARQEVAVFTTALALQPMNLDAYLQRGRAWERLKQVQEAIADSSAFLALAAPDHQSRAEALLRRSNSYARLPDQVRRLADLLELAKMEARLISLPKETALSCNDAAWGLCVAAETDRQPAVAVILARKAVELEPDNGLYRNTLGVALYRGGHYREAVATLEANDQNADFAGWDLYFLAMAQHQLGDKARAREYLDRAVRWHQEKGSGRSPPHREELAQFRVEAETLLGPR
jgi:serine/threonine protein kinase/WD40 repeat protein